MEQELHVVTGAFGYSGKRIAARLLDAGRRVRTLTNSPNRPNPFGGRVEAHPFHFDDPAKLAESLRGAAVLYNTYWVRFGQGKTGYDEAVRNSLTLFEAAREAGVRRIVHVSITNASEDSRFGYFRGKGRLERALKESGMPHAILRPAVLFGGEDILVNNIAWALRTLPVFGVFGDGQYRLQPIHVDDLARLAVEHGAGTSNVTVDAVGPETFTFRGLVEALAAIIGKQPRIITVSVSLGLEAMQIAGKLLGDVVLTREEIEGLMEGLLCTDSPPAGTIKLTDWAREHADELGRRYASELARRTNRGRAYSEL